MTPSEKDKQADHTHTHTHTHVGTHTHTRSLFAAHGLRARWSNSVAVMEQLEEISTAINNGEYFVGVFIDLKKAFDTIDHGLLMKKMESYEIGGIAYSRLNKLP